MQNNDPEPFWGSPGSKSKFEEEYMFKLATGRFFPLISTQNF